MKFFCYSYVLNKIVFLHVSLTDDINAAEARIINFIQQTDYGLRNDLRKKFEYFQCNSEKEILSKIDSNASSKIIIVDSNAVVNSLKKSLCKYGVRAFLCYDKIFCQINYQSGVVYARRNADYTNSLIKYINSIRKSSFLNVIIVFLIFFSISGFLVILGLGIINWNLHWNLSIYPLLAVLMFCGILAGLAIFMAYYQENKYYENYQNHYIYHNEELEPKIIEIKSKTQALIHTMRTIGSSPSLGKLLESDFDALYRNYSHVMRNINRIDFTDFNYIISGNYSQQDIVRIGNDIFTYALSICYINCKLALIDKLNLKNSFEQNKILDCLLNEFECSLLNILPKELVFDEDGRSYDKDHLEKWLGEKLENPFTTMSMWVYFSARYYSLFDKLFELLRYFDKQLQADINLINDLIHNYAKHMAEMSAIIEFGYERKIQQFYLYALSVTGSKEDAEEVLKLKLTIEMQSKLGIVIDALAESKLEQILSNKQQVDIFIMNLLQIQACQVRDFFLSSNFSEIEIRKFVTDLLTQATALEKPTFSVIHFVAMASNPRTPFSSKTEEAILRGILDCNQIDKEIFQWFLPQIIKKFMQCPKPDLEYVQNIIQKYATQSNALDCLYVLYDPKCSDYILDTGESVFVFDNKLSISLIKSEQYINSIFACLKKITDKSKIAWQLEGFIAEVEMQIGKGILNQEQQAQLMPDAKEFYTHNDQIVDYRQVPQIQHAHNIHTKT